MTAEIHLITDDIELVARVGAQLGPRAVIKMVSLQSDETGGEPRIVLVDVRTPGNAAAVGWLRMRHPRALVLAIVAPIALHRELYLDGASAVTPADGSAIVACCSTLTGASV